MYNIIYSMDMHNCRQVVSRTIAVAVRVLEFLASELPHCRLKWTFKQRTLCRLKFRLRIPNNVVH